MDALTAIAERHSTRKFTSNPVPQSILEQIVDAGRLAPTAMNEQPWAFVVVTDGSTRQRLADLTDYGRFIADAGACVAVFCRDTKYYLEDGCAATANILVAATALGVQSCWVAGDKKAYARRVAELLGVPAEYKLIALLALGYAAAPGGPRSKRRLDEVLHWETF